MMLAEPAATPVTRPVDETVATAVLLDFQVRVFEIVLPALSFTIAVA